jgi:subtilisin-like proprotein convertase family protein
MSKIKCERVADGRIPSERVARVRTYDGPAEEVVVSKRQVQDDYLLVSEIHSEDDKVLVELPRESASGRWRLWVNRSLVETVS